MSHGRVRGFHAPPPEGAPAREDGLCPGDGVAVPRVRASSPESSLIVITVIIPYGVVMRYVVNAPASWPEPAAVLLMIVFSFIGGAAVYRANVHIAVRAVLDAVDARTRRVLVRLVDVAWP